MQGKSTIPASLQYQDRGFMYLPDATFLPFIKTVDHDQMKHYGKEIIEVASMEVKTSVILWEQFNSLLQNKIGKLDGIEDAVKSVYAEFTWKLYNTCLAEFMDCYRQTKI